MEICTVAAGSTRSSRIRIQHHVKLGTKMYHIDFVKNRTFEIDGAVIKHTQNPVEFGFLEK